MVSIILASPNPLQVHQHYLCTSPEVYLGPQSNELAQIPYSLRNSNTSDLDLLWSWLHIRTYVWPYSRQSDPISRQDPNSGRQPKSLQLEKGIVTPLPSPCPDPTSHTDPGHTSLKKMERRCLFHRSQGILSWPANYLQAATESTKVVRPGSITLVPVILLKGLWGTWNIKKYLLD